MHQPLHCISLRVVKHSDTTTIVTAWTRERGRVVFAVPAGSGREAQRRRALMMPLSVWEGEADIRPNKELQHIRDVRAYYCGSPSVDPVKNIVALFLADFLNMVLKESEPDERMTDFIFDSVDALKRADTPTLANFHLYFLYHLGQFLGISPDTGTYTPGRCFDMREGIFTATAPLHRNYLDAQGAMMVMVLDRLNIRSLRYMRLSQSERNQMLDTILEYYTMHHAPVNMLGTLQILRTIFSV